MALQFQNVTLKDLSRGIDARSAENAIEPGFAEDLLNCKTNSQGLVSKRRGYQGYFGYVPLRVKEISRDGTDLKICFDGVTNLLTIESSPLVMYGNLGQSPTGTVSGDWNNTDVNGHYSPLAKYYDSFTIAARQTMVAGTSGFVSIEHDFATTDLLSGIVLSTSATDVSSEVIFADTHTISTTTARHDYVLAGTEDLDTFLFVSDKTTAVGTSYSANFVSADFTANVLSIPAATHQLSNVNPIPQLYELVSGDYQEVFPDRFEILANGDIEIEVASTFDGKIVMSDVPPDRTLEAAFGTSAVTLTVTPNEGSVFFTAVYLRVGNTRELIQPDQVVFDATTGQLTATIQPPAAGNIQFIYEAGTVIANCIIVQDSDTGVYADTDPQLTLWGISHEGLYPNSAFGGHVTHVDSYRRELESRLVAGLGGVIHTAQSRAEAGTEYLIPSTQIVLQERVDTGKAIGPFFFASTDTTLITRAVQADNIVDGSTEVTSAEYTGTPGEVHFYLNLTNKVGTLASLTTDDQLTVTNMAFRLLNGTHQILSVDDSLDRITVAIDVINSSDFNELAACGRAGVFTDTLTLTGTSPFVVGDELTSNLFDTTAIPEVVAVDGTLVTISGITDEVNVPGGMLLRGKRTSAGIPVVSTTNFVKGDMVSITDFTREFRVIEINTTTNTLTLDESIEFEDSSTAVAVAVTGRWIPVEAPLSAEDKIQRTYQQYFDVNDYENQPIIRSSMLQDSLFLTNGSDEVFKFDGSNIYRAGLPRWQSQLYISLDTTPTSPSILTAGVIADVVTATGTLQANQFQVDTTTALSVGQQILHDNDGGLYFIRTFDSITKVVTVNEAISGDNELGSLRGVRKLQYYFRMNAIDANQNIIASATTGANDYIVTINEDCNVQLKLIGMPVFDAYDYDRIELQVYRTEAGADPDTSDSVGLGEFFRVATIDVNYNNYEGYILFEDKSDGESALSIIDEAAVVFSGGELGNTWAQPLRAKYVTTASNRLVLANVKDYPEISMVIRKTTGDDIAPGNFNAKEFTLRRQGAGTVTDMIDTIVFQFRTAGNSISITPTTDIDNSAATSFDIDVPGHGQVAGNWVYLHHAATGVDNLLTFAGHYQIAGVAGDILTLNSNTGTSVVSANDVDSIMFSSVSKAVPVLLGTDGNYNTGLLGNNNILSYERLAMIRFANAINSVMVMTDTTITGHETFVPWASAAAGDEIGLGKIVIRAPRTDITGMSITTPNSLGGGVGEGEIVINQEVAKFSATYGAETRLFPSRLITSFPNFGEVFDAPFGLSTDSSNVIDISPADGQEITAVITFFGRAPFSSAQVEDMLVVFKENSIHVVNVTSGEVRRLETQGVGCSVPYSAAYSRNAIIFAHESGIYRLDKDLNISYVGKYLERIWNDEVVKNDLSRATATHYNRGRQYKLSVPYGTAQTDNNQVLVYDHTRETDQRVEFGAWARYDNHPATGWANLDNDAYFGSSTGQVFKLRENREPSDYRDDTAAISQEVSFAPLDFGLPGMIKVISGLVAQFQLRYTNLTGTQVQSAVNLNNSFQDLDTFSRTLDTNDGGLDQEITPSVLSVKFSLPNRRGEFLQIRMTNETLDEDMTVTGLSFSIAASSDSGIPEAKISLT